MEMLVTLKYCIVYNEFLYIAPFAEIQCLFEIVGVLIIDDTVFFDRK